jgi:ribosomal protein L37AE/L43A
MTDDLDQTIADWEARHSCLECGERLVELTAMRAGGSGIWWRHACGAEFSPEFLADHYGIPSPPRGTVTLVWPR